MTRLLSGLVAAIVALALPASVAARVHGLTLNYLARTTSYKIHDTPPKQRLNRGDVFEDTDVLLVRRGVAGSVRARCAGLNATTTTCRGRLIFREGTITATGRVVENARVSRLRITGGTGRFRGQRGVVEIRPARHDDSYFRLVLR